MNIKKQALKVQTAGKKNTPEDSILAHITRKEAALLKARGGSGRRDPHTGLLHFDDGGDGGGDGNGGNSGSSGWGGEPGGDRGDGGIGAGGGSSGDGYGGYGDQPGDYDMPSNDQTPGWASSGLSSDWNMSFASDPQMSMADFNSMFGDYANLHGDRNSFNTPDGDSSSDFFSRLAKFAQKFAMNKAVAALAQTNPVLGSIANIVGPVAANQMSDNPNEQTPVGQQIAGSMLNTIAAPAFAPVAAYNAIGGLFGLPQVPSPGSALANANLDYKGEAPGTTGLSGQAQGQGQGGNSWVDAAGGLAGLYGMYRNYSDAGKYTNSLQNMFSQNSPYAQQLRQQLERRDAASGRRSQYGPREVELQAKLAQMSSGVAPHIQQGQQAQWQNQLQMMQQLGALYKMGAFGGLKDLFSGMFGGAGGGSYAPTSNDLNSLYSGDGYGDAWSGGGDI